MVEKRRQYNLYGWGIILSVLLFGTLLEAYHDAETRPLSYQHLAISHGQYQRAYDTLQTWISENGITRDRIRESSENRQEHIHLSLTNLRNLTMAVISVNQVNVRPLLTQMKSFESLLNRIEVMIDAIDSVRPLIAPRQAAYYMAELYQMRGIVRIHWVERIQIGIAWKDYIVYPQQNMIDMLNHARKDIERSQEYWQNVWPELDRLIPIFSKKNLLDYNEAYRHILKQINDLDEDVRLVLLREWDQTFQSTDIAEQLTQRFIRQQEIIISMNSTHFRRRLQDAKNRYTLQDILSNENRPFFTLVSDLADKSELLL